MSDENLLDRVETLLQDEADCLDRADLESWMRLYTEDGTYWMPASVDQPDPLNHVSHFYDDRVMMEIRKRNFVHPRAASKDHAVRCSHIITNLRLLAGNDAGCTVRSNFQVLMYYRGEQRAFGGRYTHELRHTAAGLRIRQKRVDLINADAAHKSIIIYL